MSNGLMPTPRSVNIAITGRCNLRCKYCFYADEMTALTDLPTERWLAFFDELGRLGVMDVCLTAGLSVEINNNPCEGFTTSARVVGFLLRQRYNPDSVTAPTKLFAPPH